MAAIATKGAEEAGHAMMAELASRGATHMSFLDWALQVPEPRGDLNFDVFTMQRELYEEFGTDREGVIQKGTQVGISCWLVRWAMYWADIHSLRMLYVFPTTDQMYKFADARIRPLILGPYLRTKVPAHHVQNKGLRSIGNGMLYCTGSESERALDSTDADGIAFDEYDTLNQRNVPHAERRISSPLSKGLVRRVGVPSVPQWGIAKHYDDSDQRVWMVKCEACGEWQEIDFFKNVDKVRVLIMCADCSKPLDVATGQWVAKHPDRDVRGYHVHRLQIPGTRHLADIIKASKQREPYRVQVFWNKDLGLPYAPKEGRLSQEAIVAAQRDYFLQGSPGYVGDNLITMGVDVASVRNLHVRISEHFTDRTKRALFIGSVETFDDVVRLMNQYSVKMAAIDHLPEGRHARSVAERFRGRVYVTNVSGPPNQIDPLKVNEEDMTITAKRTEVYDGVISIVRQQRNLLPLDLPDEYVEHMMAPVRYLEQDELGKTVVGYRSTGPDDFFAAEAYDLIATEAWKVRQATQALGGEDIVPLDELMEFQRSRVNQYDEDEYRPGPDGFEYGPEPPKWGDEYEDIEGG